MIVTRYMDTRTGETLDTRAFKSRQEAWHAMPLELMTKFHLDRANSTFRYDYKDGTMAYYHEPSKLAYFILDEEVAKRYAMEEGK